MRLSYLFAIGVSFVLAAGLSLLSARFAANAIESATEIDVRRTLDTAAHDWAEVQANGLQVILTGVAPDEAKRFNALTVVGDVVDASRIIDDFTIQPTKGLAPPRFSIEVLRNDSGIKVFGLIPEASDRIALMDDLTDIAGANDVADLMQTARYSVPDGWDEAVRFALVALRQLPRSKISISARQVTVEAIADSPEAKNSLENALTRAAPAGLPISLDIAAPRPVITPFTLRFLISDQGAHFDACSADTALTQKRILEAARAIGVSEEETCTIGMGVPSPNWGTAAIQAIEALAELGQGSVTFSDADITLVAAEGTEPARFDRIVGELENALPQVFALHAVLPVPQDDDAIGPPEFVATLSPEGLVQLRGRVSDANLRHVVESFAKARFGSKTVYTAARLAPDLPADWPLRVLTGIEALSHLVNGSVTVSPDDVVLRGVTHRKNARAEISQLLSGKLGEAEKFSLNLTYQEPPEPADKPLEAGECVARIEEIQAKSKIAFEPGSATIAETSLRTMNDIAEILKRCGNLRLEIQGHTDSQGRESMNQQLSQARAQSVLNELRARRLSTSSYTAKGYGEANPIASNKTEEGRENNRRIEFKLIEPAESTPEGQNPLEELAGQNEAAPDTSEDKAEDQ